MFLFSFLVPLPEEPPPTSFFSEAERHFILSPPSPLRDPASALASRSHHCSPLLPVPPTKSPRRGFFQTYTDEMELDDAVHTAILTLKEGFEGQISRKNIEIGIIRSDKKFSASHQVASAAASALRQRDDGNPSPAARHLRHWSVLP
ncbi:hypothetical protein PIB30_057500 [Stylosanthes scabra]|uniref:Uncharacterized protein n=1 Tax=Stylosanthes scabra TaxID=79078 RepID=A0ABU6YI88_9FABA|nr:hypothetical protein [Stylosanthes scabra]